MLLKPITSEKAVRLIDHENTLLFATARQARKSEIQAEVEQLFKVRVLAVRTHIRHNQKFAYVRLQKEYPAADIATKLGMM